MGIRLRRPSQEELTVVLARAEDGEPTFPPAGWRLGARGEPPGFRRERLWRVLGTTDDVHRRAREALRGWVVHRDSGIVVNADGPPHVGQTVAMSAPLPLGYIDLTCRVAEVVDRADRFGFTYVTLPNHPEIGEESFTVVRDDAGRIGIEITSVSRHEHPLGRISPPVARLLQRRANTRYLNAMQRAVEREQE